MRLDNLRRRIWQPESVRVAFVLLALLHLCFYPAIWGKKTLLLGAQDVPSVLPNAAWGTQIEQKASFWKTPDPGAPAWQTEPYLQVIRRIYGSEHVVPLWNPYQAYGAPLAADMHSQPFSPLNFPLFLWLSPKAYDFLLLGRLLIAGFGMFYFLRYFVAFTPSLCGAIAATFGGYYILYLNMPHLNVEVWLPFGLWCGEYLLRKVTYSSFLIMTALVFLTIVGGMPESTALVLIFIYLYLVFRLASEPEWRRHWTRRVLALSGAGVSGILLAAFLLLPFYEFVRNSFNAHEKRMLGQAVGLGYDHLNNALFTYFFPLLFGPPVTNVFPGVFAGLRNYIGLVPLALILVVIARLLAWDQKEKRLNLIALFFLCAAVFVPLKRFGFSPVNIVGALPVLDMILFVKYAEVLLTVSVAALCGIGLEYIRCRSVWNGTIEKALIIAFLVIPLTLIKSGPLLFSLVEGRIVRTRFPATSILVGLTVMFAAAMVVLHFRRSDSERSREHLVRALTIVVAVELTCSFILPAYVIFGGLPYESRNPYAGAPFIHFLKSRIKNEDRIFGRDLVLHPDWASVFQLCDIRDLDALYYRKYFPFLHTFLPAPRMRFNAELGDRFRGEGDLSFASQRERRLLQLSSIRYLLSARPFGESDNFVSKIISQNAGRIQPGKEANIHRVDPMVDGLGRIALEEQPPYSRLPYELTVPLESSGRLNVFYTIDPATWAGPGDGVDFQLEVESPNGEIRRVFTDYIDPKHNEGQRRWMEANVDLSRYRGQTVRLLLSTSVGPKGDGAADWAEWAGFEFPDADAWKGRVFKPIYAGETRIFEYDRVLPRAALYSAAETLSGEEEILHRLADPSLDIFRTVLLDRSQLNQRETETVHDLNSSDDKAEVKPAQIRNYTSREVDIDTRNERASVLVLNDSDYPGWAVTVDGQASRIISANYMFRGVLLAPGKHSVQFIYSPRSFFIGVVISIVALLALMVGWVGVLVHRFGMKANSPRMSTLPQDFAESH